MLIVFLNFLLNVKGLRAKVGLSVDEKQRSLHFRLVIINTLFFIAWQLEGIFYKQKKPTIEMAFVVLEPVIYALSNDYRDGFMCGLPFICMFIICVIISSFPPLLLFAATNRKQLAIITGVLTTGLIVELVAGAYIREYVSRFAFLIFASIMCVVFTMNAEWTNALRWIYIFFVFRVYFNGDII